MDNDDVACHYRYFVTAVSLWNALVTVAHWRLILNDFKISTYTVIYKLSVQKGITK